VLVLPNSKDPPSQLTQTCVGVGVPLHVLTYLLAPPFHVALGLGAVRWAGVPEASVDQHPKARARKDDVDRALGPWNQAPLDLKPKSPAMQRGAKQTICTIVRSSSCRHSSAGLGG